MASNVLKYRCTYCNANNRLTAKKCVNCGTDLVKQKEDARAEAEERARRYREAEELRKREEERRRKEEEHRNYINSFKYTILASLKALYGEYANTNDAQKQKQILTERDKVYKDWRKDCEKKLKNKPDDLREALRPFDDVSYAWRQAETFYKNDIRIKAEAEQRRKEAEAEAEQRRKEAEAVDKNLRKNREYERIFDKYHAWLFFIIFTVFIVINTFINIKGMAPQARNTLNIVICIIVEFIAYGIPYHIYCAITRDKFKKYYDFWRKDSWKVRLILILRIIIIPVCILIFLRGLAEKLFN